MKSGCEPRDRELQECSEPYILVTLKETRSVSEPLMKTTSLQTIADAFPIRISVCSMSADLKVTLAI